MNSFLKKTAGSGRRIHRPKLGRRQLKRIDCAREQIINVEVISKSNQTNKRLRCDVTLL
jgi:hypothetical protein